MLFTHSLIHDERQSFHGTIDRSCENVNCSALILTVDLQILGQRHADIRNRLGAPPDINLDTISQFITRPEWCIRMLGAKSWTFGNIVGHVQGVNNLGKLGSWIGRSVRSVFVLG